MKSIVSMRPHNVPPRRWGVLDVGSTTVRLLVVDAHRGGPPVPLDSRKTVPRLVTSLDSRGRLTPRAADALVRVVEQARRAAMLAGCEDLLAFTTSALREARNRTSVVERIHAETGVTLRVLSSHDEACYTFLAVRRWFGWSAGQLLVLDIGEGSFELAAGRDEFPTVTASLPLGASRLTREWFRGERATRSEIQALRRHVTRVLAPITRKLTAPESPDLIVGTSKTFRSLARLVDAGPGADDPGSPGLLTEDGLRQVSAFISRMSVSDLAGLVGVSRGRAHRLVAGSVVAEGAMAALRVPELRICPWALREGVILRRLDGLIDTMPTATRFVDPILDERTRGA